MPRRSPRLLLAPLTLALLVTPHAALAQPAGQAVAPTEASRDTRMDWWREARFGMFIHWGLYAIPAGEWNGTPVPGVGEWIMHHGRIPVAEYETLAPRFNPTSFDARAWVSLAKRAGMKYIVITSKHHDGFCLFDSAHTAYDIMDASPFKRDILQELAAECRAQGIKLGFYHSIMDWHHPLARGEDFPRYAEHLRAQVRELLTNYGDVAVVWFDGEWIEEWTEEQGRALYDLCLELQPATVVNNRVGKGREGMAGLSRDRHAAGDFGTPEQEVPGTGIPGVDWESCMTMNDTWGYKTSDHNWKSATTLVRTLIETASKGGNFLLNVGPTAAGEIPPESVERLETIGRWLRTYGDSIYGTTAGPFRQLPWGRCTARPDDRGGTILYLHVFDWPADGRLLVPGLRSRVRWAWLLSESAPAPLEAAADPDGLVIAVPPEAVDPIATVIALRLDGEAEVETVAVRAGADGAITLDAAAALTTGSARYEGAPDRRCIGYWTDPASTVTWTLEVPAPGRYRLIAEQACPAETAGGAAAAEVGGQRLEWAIGSTGSWASFAEVEAGEVAFEDAGRVELTVRAAKMKGFALMNLRRVRLVPAE